MVYIDHNRAPFVAAVSRAEMQLKEAKWELFCYDHREVLSRNKLESGTAYCLGFGEMALISDSPLEKCVFDGTPLRIISPIMGGSNKKDSAIYHCKKCKVNYHLPLNAEDQAAHDKRMKEIIL